MHPTTKADTTILLLTNNQEWLLIMKLSLTKLALTAGLGLGMLCVIPIAKISATHQSPRHPVTPSPRQSLVANLNENGMTSVAEAGIDLNSLSLNGQQSKALGSNSPSLNGQTRRAESALQEQAQSQGYQLSEPELDPQDPDQEIYLYTVQYQDPEDSQWHNLCSPDADNITKAMLLSGEWDETGAHIDNDKITVACTSGVLAKCVRWGYKPWQTLQGVSLRDYHQTCTRMARADYCGNGISHTQDGTLIELYDKLGIQKPEPQAEEELVFEAAWGVDGAVLLARTRYPESLAQLRSQCPEKLEQILSEHQYLSDEQVREQAPEALIFNNSLPQ